MKNKIIKIINETPGITFQEICKKTSLTKGSISIYLNYLEKERLIFKKYNLLTLKLHPTKQGKDLYLKLKLEEITSNNNNIL